MDKEAKDRIWKLRLWVTGHTSQLIVNELEYKPLTLADFPYFYYELKLGIADRSARAV
jgi:hypothetical protein